MPIEIPCKPGEAGTGNSPIDPIDDCIELDLTDQFAPNPDWARPWCEREQRGIFRIVRFGEGEIDAMLLFGMTADQHAAGITPEITLDGSATGVVTYDDGATSTISLSTTGGSVQV